MFNLTKISVATAICTAVAVSALSVESRAGVMSITDKSSVSLASMTDQVDWRHHCHRHQGGLRYRWTHCGFRCPSNVYGYSAPSVDDYYVPSVDDYYVPSVYGYSAPSVDDYSAPSVYGYSPPPGSDLIVAAEGNYCATDVKTCLLKEPGWLGTGCSCKVPDGCARGTVVQ
jgi:hypothetical protein